MICYTNEIVPAPEPIGSNTITFEFSCEHRFCKDCARENLRIKITNNEIDKMICPQDKCGKKVNMSELKTLFADEEE